VSARTGSGTRLAFSVGVRPSRAGGSFASVLMEKTLGVDFKSFGANLFNDSAVRA